MGGLKVRLNGTRRIIVCGMKAEPSDAGQGVCIRDCYRCMALRRMPNRSNRLQRVRKLISASKRHGAAVYSGIELGRDYVHVCRPAGPHMAPAPSILFQEDPDAFRYQGTFRSDPGHWPARHRPMAEINQRSKRHWLLFSRGRASISNH